MFRSGILEWKNLILFRNYLRRHPEDARRYAELKRDLVAQVKGDGGLYRKQKNPFF
ncbi:MAG: GrpB family protein [Chlamydiae bacterium]|nr:GrpB family protein [Chlamydiota bacterium]